MKIVKIIIESIVVAFLVLTLSYNVYNYTNINFLHNDITTIKGYSVLEVVSGSMEPTIKIGDLIIIDTKDKNYKENDIVTFYDVNGSFVTHRIISIDGDQMITKGDANNSNDEATDMNKIVGKYVRKVPFLGMLFTYLKKPAMLVLILVIGILFCYMVSTDKNGKPLK